MSAGIFEEPVTPEDRDGYRRVRQALSLAITGGECEFTRFGFRDLTLHPDRSERMAPSSAPCSTITTGIAPTPASTTFPLSPDS